MNISSGKFSQDQFKYMARALFLAKKGQYSTSPNPCVGAVIVKDNCIIGEGWHKKSGENHAEINALEQALERGSNKEALSKASCYVTLEPCCYQGKTPPCTKAIINSGIKNVFVAMCDPNPKVSGKGIQMLRDAGIHVEVGLLGADAEILNDGFVKRMQHNRPKIMVKVAMSLDGKTALSNGVSQWISSQQSRRDVQKLRAKSCAILTGSGTISIDNPRMTVRANELGNSFSHKEQSIRQPIRVIIDGKGRLNPNYQVFKEPGLSIVVLPEQLPSENAFLSSPLPDTVKIMQVPFDKDQIHLDLKCIIEKLAKEYAVNNLMLEAGASLSGAILKQGLFDEICIYMAPKIMGDMARDAFQLPELKDMQEIYQLKLKSMVSIGTDLKLTLVPNDIN